MILYSHLFKCRWRTKIQMLINFLTRTDVLELDYCAEPEQLPVHPCNSYHQASRAANASGRVAHSPCIPACFVTAVPFTQWPAIMAAWRDERNHVTQADTGSPASCCSLPFQKQLTWREWKHRAAWATRVNTTEVMFVFFYFTHNKRFVHVDDVLAFFKDAQWCLDFNCCFHSPPHFWPNRFLKTFTDQTEKTERSGDSNLLNRTVFKCYCPTVPAQFTDTEFVKKSTICAGSQQTAVSRSSFLQSLGIVTVMGL